MESEGSDPEEIEEVGEDARGVGYWKQQCAILQQQNQLLRTTIEMLSEQIKKLTNENNVEDGLVNSKAQTPFSVFPEEVWEIIFGHLEDTQDFVNVCKSAKQLDGVLHSTKSTWMLRLVLCHVFKWLNQKSVLNSRLVCKQWKLAVDDYLENHPAKRPFSRDNARNYENELSVMRLSSSAVYNLWEDDKINRHSLEMNAHSANPFIGRTVVFSVEIDNDFDEYEEEEYDDPGVVEYWGRVRVFLSSLGMHIWYVEITEDSGHQKPMELYRLLRDLLIKLPNLRSLTFEADICREDFHPKALPVYMVSNPLPVMPHLESLNLCLHPEVPQTIHDNLIAIYSLQLSKLVVNMKRWKSCYSRGFVKLKELELRNVSREWLSSVEAPNLEKLSLDLNMEDYNSTQYFTTGCLFKCLSRFPVLRVLKLSVDLSVQFEEMNLETRRLYSIPTLETLVISGMCQAKISYSFLLCFPSLKYIDIRESRVFKFSEDPLVLAYLDGNAHASEEAVQVQKYLRTGSMYDSNIWRLLPSLKTLTYEKNYANVVQIKYKCTRQSYEYRQTPRTDPVRNANIGVQCSANHVIV